VARGVLDGLALAGGGDVRDARGIDAGLIDRGAPGGADDLLLVARRVRSTMRDKTRAPARSRPLPAGLSTIAIFTVLEPTSMPAVRSVSCIVGPPCAG
jgi:hypothetical protein